MATVVGGTTSYSPPGLTLASLRRFVVDYIQGANDEELLDVAEREINQAIHRINTLNWNRIVGYQDFSLVESDPDYSLTTDVKAAFHMEALNSSGNPDGRLHYKSQKTFLIEHPVATADGSPEVYTIFHNRREMVLNVPPDASFIASYPTLRMHYYRRLPLLVDDADYLDAPGEFTSYVGWQARAGIAAIRDQMDKSQFAELKAEVFWRNLIADDRDTQTDWDDTLR